MSCKTFLVCTIHLLCNFNEVIILTAESLHLLESCVSDLSILLKLLGTIHRFPRQRLALSILLSFSSLSQQHLPLSDIIHGLVLMWHQISFDQWTVLHKDTFSVGLFLCTSLAFIFMQVNKSSIRSLPHLALSATTKRVLEHATTSHYRVPRFKASTLNFHACEKLTGDVK
jgi:hypothetical protein